MEDAHGVDYKNGSKESEAPETNPLRNKYDIKYSTTDNRNCDIQK